MAMKRGYANIFPLEQAEMFYCTLKTYDEWSSNLHIKVVTSSQKQFYLFFYNVRYLAMPTQWVGANFQLADADRLWQFLASLGYSEAVRNYYIENFRANLYTITNGDFAASIIASDIEQHDALS
jgi:hypothetical protein